MCSFPVTLRTYQKEDSRALAEMFYETIHRVNCKDYSQEQIAAWAPAVPEEETWHHSFAGHLALVAVQGEEIVGFGDLDPVQGYLDRLYVKWDRQGMGIGSLLCQKLEARCAAPVLYTYASLTAQPFFLRRGYRLMYRRQVERRGVLLENARMEKVLEKAE